MYLGLTEMHRCGRVLEVRQDGRGSKRAEMGRVGQRDHKATCAASVCLLGFFADRLLRHHKSQALLLRVIEKGG